MKIDLQYQLRLVELLTEPQGNVRDAFSAMAKLMRMFYEYLEDQNDS